MPENTVQSLPTEPQLFQDHPGFQVDEKKLKMRICYKDFDESIDLAALQCALIDGSASALRRCESENKKFTTVEEYRGIASELTQEFGIPAMDVAYLMVLNDVTQQAFSALKKNCAGM